MTSDINNDGEGIAAAFNTTTSRHSEVVADDVGPAAAAGSKDHNDNRIDSDAASITTTPRTGPCNRACDASGLIQVIARSASPVRIYSI